MVRTFASSIVVASGIPTESKPRSFRRCKDFYIVVEKQGSQEPKIQSRVPQESPEHLSNQHKSWKLHCTDPEINQRGLLED